MWKVCCLFLSFTHTHNPPLPLSFHCSQFFVCLTKGWMKQYLRNVQWRPFHPCEQTHVPFLHWPCSEQRASHGNWSHKPPTYPGLQRHLPDSHTPFGPQSKLQTAAKEKRRRKKKRENVLNWCYFCVNEIKLSDENSILGRWVEMVENGWEVSDVYDIVTMYFISK